MRLIKNILSVVLLLFTLGWSLWYVFAGFGNPMDPFYWLYKYQTLEGGWLSVGSIMAGGACVRLFGAELLPLRLVGWACVVLAVAIPYCCLLTKEQRHDNIHWLAITYGLMGYGAFQELSPGTFTVPMLSGIATLAVLYYRQPQKKYLIGLGILTGLAITMRFPNVLVIPILLVLLCSKHGFKRKTVRPVAMYMALTTLVAALIYWASSYIITPTYADPVTGSHQFGKLFTELEEKGAMLVGFALLWLGVFLLPRLDRSVFERYKARFVLAGLAVGGILIYVITYAIGVRTWYNIPLTYMLSAGCLMLTLLSEKKEYWWMSSILVVATLGTDVGWLKLFPAVVCLVPVVAVQEKPMMRQYLYPVIFGFTAAVMVRFSMNSIGGGNLRNAHVVSSTSPYTHIRIMEEEQQWMDRVIMDYDSIGAPTTLALGRQAHRMRAITGCEAAWLNEFWPYIHDTLYAAKYEPLIEQRQPVVFCFYTMEYKSRKSKDGYTPIEQMLRAKGYKEIDRSAYKYMIYIPDEGVKD